jgi:hypothetical protein
MRFWISSPALQGGKKVCIYHVLETCTCCRMANKQINRGITSNTSYLLWWEHLQVILSAMFNNHCSHHAAEQASRTLFPIQLNRPVFCHSSTPPPQSWHPPTLRSISRSTLSDSMCETMQHCPSVPGLFHANVYPFNQDVSCVAQWYSARLVYRRPWVNSNSGVGGVPISSAEVTYYKGKRSNRRF